MEFAHKKRPLGERCKTVNLIISFVYFVVNNMCRFVVYSVTSLPAFAEDGLADYLFAKVDPPGDASLQ